MNSPCRDKSHAPCHTHRACTPARTQCSAHNVALAARVHDRADAPEPVSRKRPRVLRAVLDRHDTLRRTRNRPARMQIRTHQHKHKHTQTHTQAHMRPYSYVPGRTSCPVQSPPRTSCRHQTCARRARCASPAGSYPRSCLHCGLRTHKACVRVCVRGSSNSCPPDYASAQYVRPRTVRELSETAEHAPLEASAVPAPTCVSRAYRCPMRHRTHTSPLANVRVPLPANNPRLNSPS